MPLKGEAKKPPPPMAQPRDDGEVRRRLKQRIAELPDLVERRFQDEARDVGVAEADHIALSARLAHGTSTTLPDPRGSTKLHAVLGVDFGTSSTKIVARLPYLAGSPAFAVPVPQFARAEGHPHMWASRLWLTTGGLFSLVPEPGAAVACSLKAKLLKRDCERRMAVHVADVGATALEAATAFLALQIRQARGWLLTDHRSEFQRGPLEWSYNVGFPAATLDDSEFLHRYRVCIATAIRLAALSGSLSVDAVRHALASAREAAAILTQLQGAIFPEIAAAVAGFARSRKREDGLYAMVDVGAGTLDCCTFSLINAEGQDRCPIFLANVSMLGVQPYQICADDKELSAQFRLEVVSREREVIWYTRRRRYSNSPRWKTGLPLFLVGGGSYADLYRCTALELDEWLKGASKGPGGVLVRNLPPPEGLQHESNPARLHRLAVAVGLSLPALEIPEIILPTAIEDEAELPRRDYEAAYIEK